MKTVPSDAKGRVMRTLDHRCPDRIPRYDSYWPEFSKRCREHLGLGDSLSLGDHFELDITIAAADEAPLTSGATTLREGDTYRILRDGWGRVIRVRDGSYFYEELEFAVRGPQDVGITFDPPDLDARFETFTSLVHRERGKRCVFAKIGGPYIRSSFMRGKTNYLMDIAADPGFARGLADRVGEHLLQIGLESLARGDLYGTGIWIYDDMAYNHQPMMSPDSFEAIFLPVYRRMVRALKGAGARRVILHSDGNIAPLLDMLIEAGIDGIHPVEPRAGLRIPDLRERYGDRLALIGGMCNSRILPGGSRGAIADATREILSAASGGGVIIGAHSIGPDIPVENYLYYHRLVMDEGRFDACEG